MQERRTGSYFPRLEMDEWSMVKLLNASSKRVPSPALYLPPLPVRGGSFEQETERTTVLTRSMSAPSTPARSKAFWEAVMASCTTPPS